MSILFPASYFLSSISRLFYSSLICLFMGRGGHRTERDVCWRKELFFMGLSGKRYFFTSLLIGISSLVLAVTCSAKEGGRVAVVLDNSSSMKGTGTSYNEVKESVATALGLIPGSYDVGLRVFDGNGTRLISPYSRDLDPLYRALNGVTPDQGTYIGQGLLDTAEDLLEKPEGDHRLLFITDGEGAQGDVEE
ncbi:VWA domain-containing protein, partial [candidate division KSB3 bacterium]|nr:VWA domain-containing protein [candidate division KSB3 bacterium]MBD3326003.1 VWA domain-containing protein [candidate division KSB3 bacterium]